MSTLKGWGHMLANVNVLKQILGSQMLFQNRYGQDIPGEPVVKNLLAKGGNTSSISGPGMFPQTVGQLSLCTTTTEPVLQSLGAATAEPARSRACAPQQEKPLQ